MKVDIIIINYNDKQRVGRAIESALNQTWQNKRVILVDDGSDQETRDLYKNYNVEVVQLERDDKNKRTPSRARNAGIEQASGDYICFLDSDNYYSPNFVESMMKHKDEVMFCNWEIIGKDTYECNIEKVWNFQKPILDNYLRYQHVDHQCLLIKRKILDMVGYYDERLPRSQDCDLICRLLLSNCGFTHVAEKLFFFEKHEDDQTKSLASIYGKTMWTLKNGLNCNWLTPMLNTHDKVFSYYKAMRDFMSRKEWEIEYNRSDFRLAFENHDDLLGFEQSEK